MKGKEIIDNIVRAKMPDKEKIRENCHNQNAVEISAQHNGQIKRPMLKFKPAIITAICLVLFSIGVSAYYIATTLFFVPGVGLLTDNENISYYGLENPVDIETEYGTLTLTLAGKVTRNGKSELTIYVETSDIAASQTAQYPVTLGLSANGEILVKNEVIKNGSAMWGWDGFERTGYWYICRNFPDANEFDLTLCGVETSITLTEQPGNFATSKENNGVILGLYKFNNVSNMIAVDVFVENFDFDSCWKNVTADGFYGTGGEEIAPFKYEGIGAGYYQLCQFNDGTPEVKGIKSDYALIYYSTQKFNYVIFNGIEAPLIDYLKIDHIINIPVPKDGETIATDIQYTIGSHTYIISEVRREGDIIYYKDNCRLELKNINGEEAYYATTPLSGTPEYEKAVENQEYFIIDVSLFDVNNSNAIIKPGEILNFDKNAEVLKLNLITMQVTQFGDFSVEFD